MVMDDFRITTFLICPFSDKIFLVLTYLVFMIINFIFFAINSQELFKFVVCNSITGLAATPHVLAHHLKRSWPVLNISTCC